jgi:hypothetical protein
MLWLKFHPALFTDSYVNVFLHDPYRSRRQCYGHIDLSKLAYLVEPRFLHLLYSPRCATHFTYSNSIPLLTLSII